MRLGVHVRIAQGFGAAIERAERLGCEAIQVFSSSPSSWRVRELDQASAEIFRKGAARLGIRPVVLHTPYLLNLASPDDCIWGRSMEALAVALDRSAALGGDYVVTHIGSHGGAGFEAGADRAARAVAHALDARPGPAMVLLEAGSGAGNTIGSTFEELAAILERLEAWRERVGACLDTAHLWAAGYDVSSGAGLDAVLDRFDRMIGLPRLRLFHCSDTQKDLGSHSDRHWHIGRGKIGLAGFAALVNHPALAEIGGIIETPEMETGWDAENLNVLKKLRIASGGQQEG